MIILGQDFCILKKYIEFNIDAIFLLVINILTCAFFYFEIFSWVVNYFDKQMFLLRFKEFDGSYENDVKNGMSKLQ